MSEVPFQSMAARVAQAAPGEHLPLSVPMDILSAQRTADIVPTVQNRHTWFLLWYLLCFSVDIYQTVQRLANIRCLAFGQHCSVCVFLQNLLSWCFVQTCSHFADTLFSCHFCFLSFLWLCSTRTNFPPKSLTGLVMFCRLENFNSFLKVCSDL